MSLHFCIFSALAVCSYTCPLLSDDRTWQTKCAYQQCDCLEVGVSRIARCCGAQHYKIPTNLSASINVIDLSDNLISSLPAKAFAPAGLLILKDINFQNCKIDKIDREAFQGLQELETLNLNDNRIQALHPETFHGNPRLTHIYMDRNPIKTLEDGLFQNFPNLDLVSFRQCHLSKIEDRAFGHVPRLVELFLDGNQLSKLNFRIIESIPKLEALFLEDNPWRCDCDLRRLREFYVSKFLSESSEFHPSCHEPIQLKGRSWSGVAVEEFKCEGNIFIYNDRRLEYKL